MKLTKNENTLHITVDSESSDLIELFAILKNQYDNYLTIHKLDLIIENGDKSEEIPFNELFSLPSCQSLQSLSISGKLSTLNKNIFNLALQKNSSSLKALEKITLNANLNTADAACLMLTLNKFYPTVTSLDLTGNPINVTPLQKEDAFNYFCKKIKKSTLHSLTLSNVDVEEILALAFQLQFISRSLVLNLKAAESFTDEGLEILDTLKEHNSNIAVNLTMPTTLQKNVLGADLECNSKPIIFSPMRSPSPLYHATPSEANSQLANRMP